MRKSYLQLGQWSDTELIAAVESFNAAAYAELQERHAAAARTFAAELSADPAEVEAIVTATFAQLHNVLRNAAGPKVALRPYLFTAMRWAAHDHLGSGRTRTAAGAPDPPADAAELPADTAKPAAESAEPAADPAGLATGASELPEDAAERPADPADRAADAGDRLADAGDRPADAQERPADAAEARTGQAASAGDDGAAQQQAPDLGEPLFTDPAIADLVRSPLYRAFRSLPERFRAVLWHTDVEQTRPSVTATILGLSLDGVEDLADEARAGLRQACLDQHLSDVTREDCAAALEALSDAADGPVSESGALMAQQHLVGCPDCRAVGAAIADLRESVRRVVGPVFLGAAATAYLSAAKAAAAADTSLAETETAAAGLGVGGLRWTRQQPSRIRRRARPPGVLVAGGAVLCVVALTGFALAAVSNTAGRQSPPGTRSHAAAAAPAAPVPPSSASPTPSPTPASQTLVSPAPQPTTPVPTTPAPTTPAPTTPVPTTPAPTTPAPTPTPCPTPRHCRIKPCPGCPTPPPPL